MKPKRKFTDLIEASRTGKELGLPVWEVDFTLYTTGNTPCKYFVGTEEEFATQKARRSPKRTPTGNPAHRPSLAPRRMACVRRFVEANASFTTADMVACIRTEFQCHESTASVYASRALRILVKERKIKATRTATGNIYSKRTAKPKKKQVI